MLDEHSLASSIPAEWTAFEIRSLAKRARYRCELSRIDDELGEIIKVGFGATVHLAVCAAVASAPMIESR